MFRRCLTTLLASAACSCPVAAGFYRTEKTPDGLYRSVLALPETHSAKIALRRWAVRRKADPENCNCGLVSASGKPYAEIVGALKRIQTGKADL